VERVKFDRYFKLIIGEEEVTDLRAVFHIERLPGNSYSTMDLSIYNMFTSKNISEDTKITIEAGYENNKSTLFRGVVKNVQRVVTPPDVEIKLYCYDSTRTESKPLNFTLESPKSVDSIIRKLAEESEVSIKFLNVEGNQVGAFIAEGTLQHHLNELASKFNFRWHIIADGLVAYKKDGGTNRHFEISINTGLLEAPVITNRGVNFKSLMEPEIIPGDKFSVESRSAVLQQGDVTSQRARRVSFDNNIALTVVHSGDTHGDTWFTEVRGNAI